MRVLSLGLTRDFLPRPRCLALSKNLHPRYHESRSSHLTHLPASREEEDDLAPFSREANRGVGCLHELAKAIQLVNDTGQDQPNLGGSHSLKVHCHTILVIWGKGCGSPELIFFQVIPFLEQSRLQVGC